MISLKDIETWLGAPVIDQAQKLSVLFLMQAPFVYSYDEANGKEQFRQAIQRGGAAYTGIQQAKQAFFETFKSQSAGYSNDVKKIWGKQLHEPQLALYQKMQSILQDGQNVFDVLTIMDVRIAAGEPGLLPTVWHAGFLAELASEGFSQDGTPIETLLSAEGFLQATTGAGKLPLDPGADFNFYTNIDRRAEYKGTMCKHGALSHTLQWLIIKRCLDATSYRPDHLVDLFKRTGTTLGVPPIVENVHLSLWSTLVDLPADKGVTLNATVPEGMTVFVNTYFPHIKAVEDQIEVQYLEQLRTKLLAGSLGNVQGVYTSQGKLVARRPGK